MTRHCRLLVCMVATYCLASQAQVSKPVPKPSDDLGAVTGSNLYRNETLGMAITFPTDFQQRDPIIFWGAIEKRIDATHARDSNPARVPTFMANCFHPLLFVTPTSATQPAFSAIFMAEVTRSCIPQGVGESDLLDKMASIMGGIAGMQVVDQPTTYLLDNYKVHFLAAQGVPPGQSKHEAATASASMDVSDHLLLWIFMANDNIQLNRMLESSVQFGNHSPQPFSPFTMQLAPAP